MKKEPLAEIKAFLESNKARFSALDDKEAADAFGSARVDVDQEIPPDALLTWAASGPYSRLKEGQVNGANHAIKSACYAAEQLIITPDSYQFNPKNPMHVALLDGLVAATILTADDKTAILSLGKRKEREDVATFGMKVTEGMIGRARAI